MAPSMAIFSRRKHSEDKKLLSSFPTSKSYSTELEKCRIGALVPISSPLGLGLKPMATRGENFGLMHVSRPRASSTSTGRAFCCMSEVTPSQQKKVNRSKSQPVSMKMMADMRKSPVPNSAAVHFDSAALLSNSIQVTKLPGSSIFQAERPLPSVHIVENNLPTELLLPVSASSPDTDSTNSPVFTGRTIKKPSRPRPVGIISLPNCEYNHFADTSVAPLNFNKKNGERSDMIMETASSKRPLFMKDEIFPNLDLIHQPQGSTSPTDLLRRNQDLLHRIRGLEKANCEREVSLSRHASKFQALRQSHAALVETMRISYEAEISSLRESIKSMDKTKCVNLASNEELIQLRKREKELMRQVKEKDEELEVAKKDVYDLRGKLANMENLVAQREGESKVAGMGVGGISEQTVEKGLDALVLKHRVDLDDTLAIERVKTEEERQQVLEEQKKVEEYKYTVLKDVEGISQPEETQCAEIATGFKAKLSELEIARKVDLDDFEAQIRIKQEAEQVLISKNKELKSRIIDLQRLLNKDRDAIESLRNSQQDIMRIAERINEHLSEEKRRNKYFEDASQSISPHSGYSLRANTPSQDSHHSEEVRQLEKLEDQDEEVEVLKLEANALEVELKTLEEMCKKCDAEVNGLRDALARKNSKIQELKGQNADLTEMLQNYQRESGQLEKSAILGQGAQGDRRGEGLGIIIAQAEVLRNLAEDHTIEESDGESSASHSHLFEQLLQAQSALAEANKEIDLYRLDVKGYKKDVRRRDAQITTLNKQITRFQSLLHGTSLREIKALRGELQLGHRTAPPTALAHAPSTTRKKENELQNAIESRDWLRKMQQCSEQHGLVIRDLELKVEKLKKEKDRAEEKTRSALMKMAEMKGMLTPLPLPPTMEDEARLTDSTLTTAHGPTSDAQPTTSISITSKPARRESSHSRRRSGRTHSRTSSKDVTNIYTISPINTSISPPRFPSPITPLPPIPLELPSQSPAATSPPDPRPSTASSDDGLPPLGVLSSPLMAGLHNILPPAQPQLKLESAAPVSSADDNGNRLSIDFEPPGILAMSKMSESPKAQNDTKGNENGCEVIYW